MASDLNTEVENRISSDENIQNQIDAIKSGQLGSIKPTDAAPTPARNGNYTFSIGGAKPAWLTAEAGVTEVKAGDGVSVVYVAPSSYTYTHIDVSSDFVTIQELNDLGYLFKGIATPITAPGSPDGNIIYFASTPGVYPNFGGLVVEDGEVAILKSGEAWTKIPTGFTPKIITDSMLKDLNSKFDRTYTTINIWEGLVTDYGFINNTGTVVPPGTDTNWKHTPFIRTIPGTTLYYSAMYGEPNVSVIAAYDIAGNYLPGKSLLGTNALQSGDYIVDEEVYSLRFTTYTPGSVSTVSGSFYGDAIDVMAKKLENIAEELYINYETGIVKGWEDVDHSFGYIGLENGGIYGDGTDALWRHSDFLEVKTGDHLLYTLNAPSSVAIIAAFDKDKNYLSELSVAGSDTEISEGDYLIEYPTKYIRLCSSNNSIENTFSGIIYAKTQTAIKKILDSISGINTKVETLTQQTEEDRIDIVELQNLAGNNKIGYKYDINHFIHYGQSLSRGDWDSSIVSYHQKYNSLMFSGTMRVWEYRNQANKYDALIPAVEQHFIYHAEADTLTINSGASLNGNVALILDGIVVNTAVLSTDSTATAIAAKIFANKAAFTAINWDIYQEGTKIICYKLETGICIAPIFNGNTTGATGSFVRDQIGEIQVGARERGETPCVGTGEKFMEEIQSAGFDFEQYQFQVLLSAPGIGGASIEELGDRSGSLYQRLLADVTNGKILSNALGKTYACHAVSWIQGEANCAAGTSFQSYYDQMEAMFNNLNADIKAITGQTEDVHFFLYQTWCFDWYYAGFNYPYVPLAQLKISLDKPNVHMVSPIYHLPQLGDYTHFNSIGSKWFGGYCGLAYKKVMIDNEDWKPIHLTNYTVVGNVIYLKFYSRNYPLVFDTVNVVDRGISKGFQIRNANDFNQNSFLDIITNVQIVRPDTIKITCSANPAGKKLTYAINGTGNTNMSSGNLRDSSTDVFNFPIVDGGADVEHKLYNWCPLFEQILN